MIVVPAATPVKVPVELTVAIELLLLLHTPPETASDNEVVAPGQTTGVPVMVPVVIAGSIVADVAVVTEPQLLVTV